MFELDVRYYVASLLHPKYRQLKGCSKNERERVYKYIRKRMSEIINESTEEPEVIQPIYKKMKTQTSIFEQYEDDSDFNEPMDDNTSSGSEDYAFIPPKVDELARYLSMDIDKTFLCEDPLEFWRKHQQIFPVLTKLARRIHCIPASSAAVERQFSGAGVVINERRTSLEPAQVNNILFIRSVQSVESKK